MLDTKPAPESAAPLLSIVNLVDTSATSTSADIFSPLLEKSLGEESSPKKPSNFNGTSRLTHLASGNLKGYVKGNADTSAQKSKSQSVRDSKELLKRRKPKASLLKSNSSFIARANPHESLSRRVQDHKPEGNYAFVNNGRAFLWLDLSATNKV